MWCEWSEMGTRIVRMNATLKMFDLVRDGQAHNCLEGEKM
eukprot:SAG31_NODE_20741_length_566_cov_1.199143_1_plen_39_part_01